MGSRDIHRLGPFVAGGLGSLGEYLRGTGEYFLSCYLSSPGDVSVLSSRHDQNVALWRRRGTRVELVRLWELERFSGQKHHFWPLYTEAAVTEFLNGLLSGEGLSLADVSAVWGTPGVPGNQPIPMPPGAEAFPLHSAAHLFSGMLMDTRIFAEETILGMAVDGGPDSVQETETKAAWYMGCLSRRGHMDFLPVESPAPLYTAAQVLFGKEPGTLMALASACRTEIAFDAEAAVAALSLYGGRDAPLLVSLPFVAELIKETERQISASDLDSAFSTEENTQSAVMSAVQRCCELIMIRNIERLCALGQVRPRDCYLSTSGGFALNCPANSMLLERFGFRGLLTPPCANDSGQAMGLGMLALHQTGVLATADLRIDTAYHGAPPGDTDAALSEFAKWIEDVSDFSPEQFVADITDNVVAWVDGPAEMGPRALGHRSLLGDPRSLKVKDLLNEYKQRQWWRPVAPIVLAERTGEWFGNDRPSPFMLQTVRVRDEVADRIPAIPHLDGTARHQTLTRRANPLLYKAIEAFGDATGVPMLCNTSLNDKGEPIVQSAAEALTFCVRKGIAVAYIEGKRVSLRPAGDVPLGPRPRDVAAFAGQEPQRDRLWQSWTDRGYTEPGMLMLARSPELRTAEGRDERTNVARVNALAEYGLANHSGFRTMFERFRRMYGPGSKFVEDGAPLPSRWTGVED